MRQTAHVALRALFRLASLAEAGLPGMTQLNSGKRLVGRICVVVSAAPSCRSMQVRLGQGLHITRSSLTGDEAAYITRLEWLQTQLSNR